MGRDLGAEIEIPDLIQVGRRPPVVAPAFEDGESVSWKGPVPTGLRGQLAPCSSKRRCRIGQVAAYRCWGSEQIGRDRYSRKRSSSSGSTPVMAAKVVRLGDLERGAIQRLMLKATSATVNRSPFDQRMPSRSLNSQVFKSSDGCQLSAR
jgi:hypothetical protein